VRDGRGRLGLSLRHAELVHESERTRVTRLFYADGTVIRKEPLGPDAERRVAHETALLARLRGGTGLAQLADVPRYPGSVILADAGPTNLAELVKPLAVDDPRCRGDAPPGSDPPGHNAS
jgi:hypothetical protein